MYVCVCVCVCVCVYVWITVEIYCAWNKEAKFHILPARTINNLMSCIIIMNFSANTGVTTAGWWRRCKFCIFQQENVVSMSASFYFLRSVVQSLSIMQPVFSCQNLCSWIWLNGNCCTWLNGNCCTWLNSNCCTQLNGNCCIWLNSNCSTWWNDNCCTWLNGNMIER